MPRRFARFPWRRQGYASSGRPAADLAAPPAGAAPGARQATPQGAEHPDYALLLRELARAQADEQAMVLQVLQLSEVVRQVRDDRRLMQAERDHWRRQARERALTVGELRRQLAATVEAKR